MVVWSLLLLLLGSICRDCCDCQSSISDYGWDCQSSTGQGGHISKAFLNGVQSQEKADITLQPPAPSAVRWGLWDPQHQAQPRVSPGWQGCHPALEFSWMKYAMRVPHPAGVNNDCIKEFFPLCLFKAPVKVRTGSLLWDKCTLRCHCVTPCVHNCK